MLENLAMHETILFVTAASATIILLIQTIMAMFGIGGGEIDADGADIDIDVSDGGIELGIDSDSDFAEQGQAMVGYDSGLRVFTIKGIMAFLMVGGWVGFLLSRSRVHIAVAALFALAGGIIALVGMAKIMQALLGLQSDGTLRINNALGQIGQVYIRIPAEEKGLGKVTVTVQERLCEFEALTEESEMIKTGEMVYITDVRPGNILVVEKVKEEEPE